MPKLRVGGSSGGGSEMDQALSTLLAVIIGGLITFATNYLVERQKNKTEEKKREQEEKTKELNLRYEAYINFLSVKYDDLLKQSPDGEEDFDPDLINEIYAPVIVYGSPKVSTLFARSFPTKNWESIEAAKRLLMSELVLEKGGKLSLSASIENKELDAYMGIRDDKKVP